MSEYSAVVFESGGNVETRGFVAVYRPPSRTPRGGGRGALHRWDLPYVNWAYGADTGRLSGHEFDGCHAVGLEYLGRLVASIRPAYGDDDEPPIVSTMEVDYYTATGMEPLPPILEKHDGFGPWRYVPYHELGSAGIFAQNFVRGEEEGLFLP